MPKLTAARRELRRSQITTAATRCFVRQGMAGTSIADITAESGLSAGSIYAHYRSKAELVEAVSAEVIERRAVTLGGYAAEAQPPSPTQLLARLVEALDPEDAKVGVQAWGAATTDPGIREVVVRLTERIQDLMQTCVEAWLLKVKKSPADEARIRAADLAPHLMARYQAYLLRVALLGEPGAVDLAAVSAIVAWVE